MAETLRLLTFRRVTWILRLPSPGQTHQPTLLLCCLTPLAPTLLTQYAIHIHIHDPYASFPGQAFRLPDVYTLPFLIISLAILTVHSEILTLKNNIVKCFGNKNQIVGNICFFSPRCERFWRKLFSQEGYVSCVHPGGIKTNIATRARMEGASSEQQEKNRVAFNKTLVTSPEKAAAVILRGVERNKARILIGADARIADVILRLAPTKGPALLERAVRRISGIK